MSDQPDDLQALLEQLKAATADNPPYKGFSDDEHALMDQIRAHGAAAIETLITFLTQLMADTEETIAVDTGDEDVTYYYAEVHIVAVLGDLPLTEDHVRRLFALLEEYPDNDWYHSQLVDSLGKRCAVIIEPALEILRDRAVDYLHRNTAAEILETVVKVCPDQREYVAGQLVAIMSAVKRKQERNNDRAVNAFMLSALSETRQEQYIPFIKKMYKARRVDETITDLNWVLDAIQGIDPMARHAGAGIPDWLAQNAERLAELANAMGIEDRGDLLDLIAAGAGPGAFADDEDNEAMARNSPSSGTSIFPELTLPFHAKKRPGRNDPCWCGSGKKYKHCHMREDQKNRDSN